MSLETISVADLLRFAVDRSIYVLAVYNRQETRLAPHSLFERHDDLFLRAVTVEVDGRTPRMLKLGTFKLAGLGNVRLEGSAFDAEALFGALAEPVPDVTDRG